MTGNDAVHPGQIDTDNPEVVEQLFELVNLIVEDRMSIPKRMAERYNLLPETKRNQVAQRDTPKV